MAEQVLLSQVEEVLGGGPEENSKVALCRYNGHEGIIDLEGNDIVPFTYSTINGYVSDDCDRLAVVNDEKLLGFVDSSGQEIIPCQFLFELFGSVPFQFYEERFPILDKNGLIGFIDPNGNVVISGQFHDVRKFQNGFCAVMNDKGKWGYVTKDGTLRVPFKYKEAYSVSNNGEARVVERVLCFDKEKVIKIKLTN